MNPKLEAIQYLDFSYPGALPWELLIARIKEIETGVDSTTVDGGIESGDTSSDSLDRRVEAILAYLNQHGYQMASFERLRQKIDSSLTDDEFQLLIANNRATLRQATLKGGKPGLAKVVP
jgi:hypothetical protein